MGDFNVERRIFLQDTYLLSKVGMSAPVGALGDLGPGLARFRFQAGCAFWFTKPRNPF